MSSATKTAVDTTGAPNVRQHRANSRGVSALMYAAQQGNVDRVRKIIRDQSSSLFERDRTGKSALHYCCTSDNLCSAHAADLLVMAAPDLIEEHDEDGFTPLHLAVIAGNMQLVTFLLANNADVTAVDNEKHSVVHWATVCGETAALRAVLAAGAPVSSPDVHGGYPLHYAAQMCGGVTNDRDSSLGMQVLQTLLSHRDIVVSVTDGDKRQPLLWAASAGSSKAVLALVRAGAAIEAADKDGLTAIHCAASRGHTDCLDTLLTLCGASPDVIDSNGCTALHYAVTLGHADATALLLAHGADPNRQDRKGRSPAHCGCAKGQFETVKLIGSHGANLWLRNARGDLPLHEAAASGRRELVKWLLEMRPSQVNARNNDGRCPLHMAALNDNADMCKILLDAGAQVNPILRTSKNVFMTPLDCALQRGFRSTAKYLQLHGGIPASRLATGQRNQIINSALNMQIRDDMTFLGDSSSDSERENVNSVKGGKRRHRKNIVNKQNRKKDSLSGSDAETGRQSKLDGIESRAKKKMNEHVEKRISAKKESPQSAVPTSRRSGSRKLPTSRVDYNNEIIINGRTEINIHQTNEIIIDKEPVIVDRVNETLVPSEVTESRPIVIEKNRRPRSAKHGKVKSGRSSAEKDISLAHRDKITSPETAIQQEIREKELLKQQYLRDQSTNTSEETVETVIENKPTKIVAPVETVDEKDDMVHGSQKLADQQSLMSNTSEDVENHKDFVVEASIHAPPKSVIAELESQAEEEKKVSELEENTKSDEGNEAVEVVEEVLNKKLIETTVKSPDKQDDITVMDTQQDNDLPNGIKNEYATNNINEDDDGNKTPSTVEENKDIIKQDVEDKQESQEIIETVLSAENEVNVTSTEHSSVIQPVNGNATAEIKHTIIESEEVKEDGEVVDKPVDNQTVDDVEREVEDNKDLNHATMQEQDFKEDSKLCRSSADKLKAVEVTEIDENQSTNSELTKPEPDNEYQAAVVNKVIEPEVELNNIENDTDKEGNDNRSAEILPTNEKNITDIKLIQSIGHNEKREDGKASQVELEKTGEKVEIGTPEKHSKGKKTVEPKKKRQSKKEVIKGKEGDKEFEDYSDDFSSEDSSVSTPIKRTHKSFRVLDEGEVKELDKGKPKRGRTKRSAKKGSRSRSMENKIKEAVKEKPLKRSKIPTPLAKNALSKSDKHLDKIYKPEGKAQSTLDGRVPSLPNIHQGKVKESERRIKPEPPRPESNMSAPLLTSLYSDNERDTASEAEEDTKRSKKRVKKRSRTRDARSAGSDYESSNLIDSGFEPSPRTTRIPKWKNMSDRGVNMTSVTQSIQNNIRRYHLERKIFQHLLELKRLQIRAGQHNETVLVKRAIDAYHQSCASTVGAGRYIPDDFSFKSFERFLYESLRKLQKTDVEYMKGLPEAPTNPLLCTRSTNRCMHATHAYTGIPCAAYLPRMDHHTIPKVGYNDVSCKPGTGFLPNINSKKAVTLELSHGNDKQVISLPTDRLDQNKRYYVTFTVKGHDSSPSNGEEGRNSRTAHRHSKSD